MKNPNEISDKQVDQLVNNSALNDAALLKTAQENLDKKNAENRVKRYETSLTFVQQAVDGRVATLRTARQSEAAARAEVKKFASAQAEFVTNGNIRPLATLLYPSDAYSRDVVVRDYGIVGK